MEKLATFLNGYEYETFSFDRLNYNISSLDIGQNFILFFDFDKNESINQMIELRYESIKQQFLEVKKLFFYLPNIKIPKDVAKIFRYFLPHLDPLLHHRFDYKVIIDLMGDFFYESVYEDILPALGYTGKIRTGFLLFEGGDGYVIRFSNYDFKNKLKNPLDVIYEYIKHKNAYYSEQIFSSRRRVDDNNFKDSLNKHLDAETLDKIESFKRALQEMKNTGQLLYALPILKGILKEHSEAINLESISQIQITNDYKIILPYFGRLEIELSDLTKSVYILFYYNPIGIDITELWKYEAQLITIYTNISRLIDYDAIVTSVKSLTSPENKSIYTHISRVKSAFYKVMDEQYADHYIIKSIGHGNTFKFIPVIKPVDRVLKGEDFF